MLPGVRLVWADMLPSHVWGDAEDPKIIDNLRCKLNKQVRKIIKWLGGQCLVSQVFGLAFHTSFARTGYTCLRRGMTFILQTCLLACRQGLGVLRMGDGIEVYKLV